MELRSCIFGLEEERFRIFRVYEYGVQVVAHCCSFSSLISALQGHTSLEHIIDFET
jgi:hypothetical protein